MYDVYIKQHHFHLFRLKINQVAENRNMCLFSAQLTVLLGTVILSSNVNHIVDVHIKKEKISYLVYIHFVEQAWT